MRVKLADANTPRDFEFADRLRRNRARGRAAAAARPARGSPRSRTPPSTRSTATFDYDGDLKELADRVEDVRGAEVLSLGHALRDRQGPRRRRDRGRPTTSSTASAARTRSATCGWRPSPTSTSPARTRTGRIRSPTSPSSTTGSSPTTTSGSRRLERSGHRFQSECDSEIIAVYLAERMAEGASLEDAMRQSLEELDGVFTYICVTEDALGMAKDELAAKPLVLYEADDLVALASEEIAIRAVDRPRDRHVRPVRGRGDGVAHADLRRARPRRARRHASRASPRSTATARTFDART